VGTPIPVELTIVNNGNRPAEALTVVATPTSGSVATTTPGCSAGAVLACRLQALPARSTTHVRLTLTSGVAGTLRLRAKVSAVAATAVTVAPSLELLSCATSGTEADQRIAGTNGRDRICGFGGDDTIFARGGDDWIDGGVGRDRLYGGDGNDTIKGGIGIDRIFGGRGNDTIWVGGDGFVDIVDCGPGLDTVHTDSIDRLVNCERVLH
jgi:hypothetical protein